MLLKKNGEYCTDSVVFDCTDEASTLVFWDIISETTTVYSLALGIIHHVGRAYNHTFGNAFITTKINFRNSTSVLSELTIIGASTLIGYFIWCNGHMEILRIDDIYSSDISKYFYNFFHVGFISIENQ